MNPKQFLTVGGIILLLLGILGYILPGGEILGRAWYLISGENIAHLLLGVVALAVVYWTKASSQRLLTQVVAIIALFFAIYGFYVAGNLSPNTFGVANLENPYDNLLHLVVGVWAVYAGWFSKS